MSVLVDTSVWVDHLRRGDAGLAALLEEGRVLAYDHVIGELACGGIRNRTEVLDLLRALPRAPVASFEEVLHLVESRGLHGRGLGWIDAHLLASALLTGVPLWTLDRRLAAAAGALGCRWEPALEG